jgi:hypothetical protein
LRTNLVVGILTFNDGIAINSVDDTSLNLTSPASSTAASHSSFTRFRLENPMTAKFPLCMMALWNNLVTPPRCS